MKCPHCSAEIPGNSKFCNECGTLLSDPANTTPTSSLSAVDHASLLQKYIPPELAKKILSAGKQIESERRLVTVVFADVSGFTAMSEKLDAEEVSSVLNDCFKGLISIVYKYEGVIDKFIGDEIMAIFGAPLAHENDPERAVRCSMEMMEYMDRFNSLSPVSLPEPLGLHISMNTGMVVAGNVGSDLRMNYSVIGDTVNLGSRLKHVAERGEIVVSEDTYRIVSSLVSTEEPRLVEIKGKSAPAKVYKILSLKEGIEPGTRITQKSPIIGRDREINQLKMAIQQVLLKKEQRLFIRGEAGVGKTRLKLELIQHAKSAGITAYEGKCSSFEINTPYYLWTTLLKDILRLKADTGESETRKRLHDMLQILSLEKHEPYLATLLSLRYEEILLEEDQERKKKIFESLKEFIRALSGRKPFLFLLEDVHWIDRFSQDLLNYLFIEKELAPAMFVPLFRDEYIHSKELIEKGGTLIDLNCLTKPDAQKLMCARLQAEDVPANLAELIYKRSEGNPFFIEELVRTLVDKNVVAVKKRKTEIVKTDFENILPETVQGVIMARIDRLEERLKDVLYGASVIGREFDKSLLKEILTKKETVDSSLAELLSVELILEKEESREYAYLFKHYLIQEVAYNTILRKKRRQLHFLIAQTIEKVFADKLKEFYEIIAYHYEKAEEWEKAANYLSMAGRKAETLFTKEESRNFQGRREEAINKLFSAEGAERPVLRTVQKINSIVLLISLILAIGFNGILVFKSGIGTWWQLTATIVWATMFVWMVMAVWGFFIKLSFRPRARLFEVRETGISVQLYKESGIDIPFGEILTIFLSSLKGVSPWTGTWRYTLSVSLSRPWRFSARPGGNSLPTGFAAKEGSVIVLRKNAAGDFRSAFFPWLSLDVKKNKSKNVVLTPNAPISFFEEAQIAFSKWRMKNEFPRRKSRTSESEESPIVVQPTKSVVAAGLSSVYTIFYLLPLVMTLLSLNIIQEHEITEFTIWSVYLFALVSLLLVAGMTLFQITIAKRYKETKYVFLRDRLSYALPYKGVPPGQILYEDISEIRHVEGFPRSLFGLSNIELVLLRPIRLYKKAELFSVLTLIDIKNGKDAVEQLRKRIFGHNNALPTER